MPLHRDDPLLDADPDIDPSLTKYAVAESALRTGPIPKDFDFKKRYEKGQGPELTWIRNIRYWDHATLDVVRGDSASAYARKRIFLPGNVYGEDRANNEAEILKNVKHRHIVALRSTYWSPGIMTLHFTPAAEFDLRNFLDMLELRLIRNQDHSRDLQLLKDLTLLEESFGCLSGALAKIHEGVMTMAKFDLRTF